MHTRAGVARPERAADHGPVRNWLLTAPWWAVSLLIGSFYAVGNVLTGRFVGDESWTEAVVPGVIVGLLFGAVTGPPTARMNRPVREAAGNVSRNQLQRVATLARRGAVPNDPELRRAARRVPLQQREQLVRRRWWALPFSALVLVLTVWLALTSSPAWLGWLLAVLMLNLVAVHLWLPRHLARRAELLAEPPT